MTWMTDLWNNVNLVPAFNGRSLSQITLPGTHDAGCSLDRGWAMNVLARTQLQTIQQQAADGIRYFDIRPTRALSGEFLIHHGPYRGERLDGAHGVLQQLGNFMQGLTAAGDRDLLILNISHFLGFDATAHRDLITQINQWLGPYLVPYTQWGTHPLNLFSAPLVTVLTNPATAAIAPRIAILYDGALDQPIDLYISGTIAGPPHAPAPGAAQGQMPPGFFLLSPKYVPVANPIYLFDWYADATTIDELRTDQLAKLRNRTNYRYDNLAAGPARWPGGNGPWATANIPGGVVDTLHLLSWTQTPQKRLSPFATRDPITVAANETNPLLLDLFNNHANGWAGRNYDPTADPKINIIYVDNYASLIHDVTGSPWAGIALPVAIAARLNVGTLTW